MLYLLVAAIGVGLIVGMARAGWRLNVSVPLRGAPWILLSLGLQILTVVHLRQFGPTVMAVFIMISMLVLFYGIWVDRSPAMAVVAVGVALNFTVMLANGGLMPLATDLVASESQHSSLAVGEVPNRSKARIVATEDVRLLFLADVIPSPGGGLLSIGDIVLAIGVGVLAWERVGRREVEAV